MRDHDKSKGRPPQQTFQPLDPVQVEVICGLVEQKHVGFGHKRLGDGEPLAPAAAQARNCAVHAGTSWSVAFRKAGAAQRFA